MNKYIKYLPLLAMFGFFVVVMTAKSYASFISPTKVFINDGQTSTSISITNNSDETAVYTLEWERRVRSEDGKQVQLLKEEETYQGYQPADPYLIFSPKKVVVQPDETQRVRILARRPAGMAPGEYRSHLKITSDDVQPIQKPEVNKGEFGGVFVIRPSISIPVMLRTGKTLIDIKIADSKIIHQGNLDLIEINMVNNSTRSIYGRSTIKCVTADSQEIKEQSNGFRLYAETKTSNEKFRLPETVVPSKCSSLELQLFAVRDPDYRDAIATAKVK